MKNWVRWAIVGLIVVVIGGLYYYKNIYNKGETKDPKKNDYIYTSTENINEALPTIMTLSTTTCPACREMEAVLRKFAPKYKDKVNVVKIDLNKNPEYGYAFKVSVVPTNIFMKKGKEVFKGETGAMDEKSIKEIFKEMGVSLDD